MVCLANQCGGHAKLYFPMQRIALLFFDMVYFLIGSVSPCSCPLIEPHRGGGHNDRIRGLSDHAVGMKCFLMVRVYPWFLLVHRQKASKQLGKHDVLTIYPVVL